jgi:hypothetical protein
MLTTRRAVAFSLALTLGCTARAAALAGATTTPAQTLVPIPSRTYIAVNPMGLALDIATVEVENAVAQGVTVGGVGSYINIEDARFTTFDFKVRYYPGDVVLRDWSLGGTIGYTRFSNLVNGTRETLNAPTLGIIVDRNWMPGRGQHVVIGTGLGLKRIITSSEERTRVDMERALVTGRLIIGWAF